jgi:DNA adenine methylase
MDKKTSVNYIKKKFELNHILSQGILGNKKLFSTSYIEEKINKFIISRPKPFVKWVGGKRQLLRQFIQRDLYPPANFNINKNTYFEPFVGGGAVFFDLLPKKAILSDMNSELVISYNVIKERTEKLIKKLKQHDKNNSKEYYLKIRAQNLNRLSNVSIAARFIYLNRTCFNGIYRVNSQGQFNVPFSPYKNPNIINKENLKKVSDALKKVKILHQDYKKTLKNAKVGDFIYLDPPYAKLEKNYSFTLYTKEGFGDSEQLEVRDMFYELHKRGCYVMLSNSDTPFINKIYGELVKKDSKIKISHLKAARFINSKVTSRGKINEVLVTNY